MTLIHVGKTKTGIKSLLITERTIPSQSPGELDELRNL
jgi:hypothetical protein